MTAQSNVLDRAHAALEKRRAATSGRQGAAIPVSAAPGDAALIQLVVNTEVLDVLMEFLEDAIYIRSEGDIPNTVALTMRAERIATAIVTADERVTPEPQQETT